MSSPYMKNRSSKPPVTANADRRTIRKAPARTSAGQLT